MAGLWGNYGAIIAAKARPGLRGLKADAVRWQLDVLAAAKARPRLRGLKDICYWGPALTLSGCRGASRLEGTERPVPPPSMPVVTML